MIHAKRYTPSNEDGEMLPDDDGYWYTEDDYDALAARLAEAERLLCLTRSSLGNRTPLLNAEVDSFLVQPLTAQEDKP